VTFDETLARHLDAIRRHDLEALADTVAPDGLVLVTARGELVRSTGEFLDRHRDWFASPGWELDAHPVEMFRSADLSVAVLELDYRDRPALRQRSYLTLVFARRDGRWLMVQDQNTPISD
jgi:uncharacterized protein (TIGR02246 family)